MTQPSNERWRPITGFEDLYEVSDMGRVRSGDHYTAGRNGSTRRVPGRVLKPSLSKTGYPRVNLCRDGGKTMRLIHQLVLEAFVGPRPDGTITCHWNDVPTDNRLTNLRWGTPSENQHDKLRNGGHHYANREHCSKGHLLTPNNIYREPSRPRARNCRQCRSQRSRERYIADKLSGRR